jgi:ribosomal protein S18 acetylase RimI-like enzyme
MSIWVKQTPDTLSAHLITVGKDSNKECGELVCQRIDTNAYALSIHIDEAYQKQGWSRRLFKELFKSVELEPDTLLVIDADASNGYWDYLGFVPNRYGYDYKGRRAFSTRGYEKIATVRRVENRLGIG